MEIPDKLTFSLLNKKNTFRTVSPDDISEEYIDSLNLSRRFLDNVNTKITFEEQKKYIDNINKSSSNSINGLFVNNTLVGTAGIQNLNLKNTPLIMGILIFNNSRGLGFGKILVWACCHLVFSTTEENRITAGIEKENVPSVKTFQACGFTIFKEFEKAFWMEVSPDNLIRPHRISNIIISK